MSTVGWIWNELYGREEGWLKTTKGVKNCVFKLGNYAIEWHKKCSYGSISPNLVNLQGVLKDAKNALAFAELPEKIQKFTQACTKDSYQALIESTGVITTANDIASLVNSRIIHLEGITLSGLNISNLFGMILSNADGAIKNIGRIWDALVLDNPEIDAQMVIELSLIDLAKCISYIALATLCLVSQLFIRIASLSFWLLVCNTSALAFTILEEFSSRSYRELNPYYPKLPYV